MKVLIIEDEFTLADAISTKLKKENYNVEIITDGLDGYYYAKTNSYDLIILDVMLPNMDGFEILKELRKNNVTSKIIMLTAASTLSNKLNGQSTTYKNIFLYQSMSGDASEGTSTFTSKNSKITTNKGDTFYITNTTATINLENNEIVNNDETGNFLRAQKDLWGTTNSNGGIVTLNMTNQKAYRNIEMDSISTLDKTSSIKLTGDSYVTSLENKDTKNNNIDFNGYKLYVNGVAIN